MNPQLLSYIKAARDKKQTDDKIEASLVGSGWPADQVKAALSSDPDLPVPPPPPTSSQMPSVGSIGQPINVVHTSTTRGFEYIIMFIALWIAAVCFGGMLHNVVSSWFGGSGDAASTIYVSGLVVSLPIFAFLFIRTKKVELKDQTILKDPSRRRAMHFTMTLAFLAGVGHIAFYVYTLLGGGGDYGSGGFENLAHMLVTVLIAGGIFFYYWHDEHGRSAQ